MGTQYAGNPGNFPDEVTIPSGSDPPSSAVFDTAFEGELDRTAWLFANQGTAAWNAPQANTAVFATVATGSDFFNANFDPVGQRWLACGRINTSGFVQAVYSFDGTDAWKDLGTAFSAGLGGTPIALAVVNDPSTAGDAYMTAATASAFTTFGWNGSGWSPLTNGSSSGLTGVEDVELASFKGIVVLAIGSSNDAFPLLFTNDGFTTAAGTFPVPVPVLAWALRSSPSILIAAPLYQANATPFLLTSVDGVTWITQTAGFGAHLLPTDQIEGLSFGGDSSGPCWLMVVTPSGGGTKILRSVDGINWTLAQTLTTELAGIAAVGARVWYALGPDFVGSTRILVSQNGGVSWASSPAVVDGPTASFGSTFVGSPQQALFVSLTNARTSAAFGAGPAIT